MESANPSSAVPSGESRFGKYRLVQHIASGGMAHLFLASIDGPDGFSKTCVIKRILPEYATLESFSRMFADEAKVAALLSHPNIVQVFDFGKIDGQYYLAMEWIQGESLDRVLRHAARRSIPVGPRLAVDVGIAVSAALAYAHDKTLPDGTPLQLVHRDITPGNILVSREGIIKLGDFGIVKSTVNLERTVAGVVKGKYAYMSPEQVTNRPLDQRSDLFSLGIVLYEASTGKRLFKRETMEATILAASAAEVPRPTEFLKDFPQELERILLRLLAKNPDDRYGSAHELRDDLERFRASQNWTSGGRELVMLMNTLFPLDTTARRSGLITSVGSHSGTGTSSRRALSDSNPSAGPKPDSGPKPGSGSSPGTGSLEVLGTIQGTLAFGTGIHEEEPSVRPEPPASWRSNAAAERATILSETPVPPPPPAGPPWGIIAAATAALIGSAVFWFLIA